MELVLRFLQDGSSMTSGELEMSNVDLSTELHTDDHHTAWFPGKTPLYHTTSDTLLEELVNLKR